MSKQHQADTYPVPDGVLEKIAELELKYAMTTAEFKEKERTGEDVPWNAETHWWACWMYEILPGNRCYHPDADYRQALWALMEERGDTPFYPPIQFKLKPEFAGLRKAEMMARLAPHHQLSVEPEQAIQRPERKRRKKAAAQNEVADTWEPDVLPFMDEAQ